MIPEAVVQITSVTSLKTASFSNDFGEYSYKNVKENLMFGYELKPMADNRTIQFATPKKHCLICCIFIRSNNSEQELEELRLDEDYLHDDLNKDLLMEYCAKFQSKALDHQAKPDYDFLSKRCGMNNLQEFKKATAELLKKVDLKKKQNDFEYLLSNKTNSEKILRFGEFVNSLTE